MTLKVTETCRDIDELNPVARKAILLFFQECYKAGVKIFVTETYRSPARQAYLYEQGRTRSGSIVTWTLKSYHASRLAWDIGAATIDGNTDMYSVSVLNKAGAIARKLGITWGGDWKNNVDRPHFEVKSTWTMPKGYAMEGAVSVPAKSSGRISIVKSVTNLPKVVTVVADEKLEEAKSVAKYIPTVGDSTSPTLKTSLVNELKDALKRGDINDDKWVKAAEAGTLSIVDAQLLLTHIKRKSSK